MQITRIRSNTNKVKKSEIVVIIPTDDNSIKYKWCNACQSTKEINATNFNKDSSRKDGIDHICRECRVLYRKEGNYGQQKHFNSKDGG